MKIWAIDWSQAPENARWWAIDGDGHAYWYCMLQIAAATTFWFSARQTAPSFRASLQERPPAPELHSPAPVQAAVACLLRR